MRKTFFALLPLTLAACLSSLFSPLAKADHPFTIAAEDSWPPFSNEQGKGISYNLVKAAYETVGRHFKTEVYPYSRALLLTENGQVDVCWNVTRQPSTEALFHFGEEPLLLAKASYFFPKGKALDFTRPADIPKGLNIAVIIDYEYGDEYERYKHNFHEILVDSQEQIIRMLLANRIDAAIMFDEVAKYHLKQMGLAEDAIEKGSINHVSQIYVAFSQHNPDHQQLAADLDKGLRIIKETGEYERLFLLPDDE